MFVLRANVGGNYVRIFSAFEYESYKAFLTLRTALWSVLIDIIYYLFSV